MLSNRMRPDARSAPIDDACARGKADSPSNAPLVTLCAVSSSWAMLEENLGFFPGGTVGSGDVEAGKRSSLGSGRGIGGSSADDAPDAATKSAMVARRTTMTPKRVSTKNCLPPVYQTMGGPRQRVPYYNLPVFGNSETFYKYNRPTLAETSTLACPDRFRLRRCCRGNPHRGHALPR